jgi:hypothetical protein
MRIDRTYIDDLVAGTFGAIDYPKHPFDVRKLATGHIVSSVGGAIVVAQIREAGGQASSGADRCRLRDAGGDRSSARDKSGFRRCARQQSLRRIGSVGASRGE